MTINLTTIDGIIQSNKLGELYENNMDCQWNITSNAWVELTFDRFDTELYDDYVTVYDGTSLSSPVIDQFSGSERPPPLISSGNNLYVRFTTDAAQNKQYEGFRAIYRGKNRYILNGGKCVQYKGKTTFTQTDGSPSFVTNHDLLLHMRTKKMTNDDLKHEFKFKCVSEHCWTSFDNPRVLIFTYFCF